MDRSALFFDVDGTILSEITKKVPFSAAEALKKAQRRGHLLFVNTGRPYCELPAKVLEVPFDGFLCGCGTHLVYRGEVLFRRYIPKEKGLAYLDLMEACGVDGICEAAEDIYFPGKVSRFEGLEETRKSFGRRNLGKKSVQEDKDFVYDKLFVYTDEKSDRKRFLSEIGKDMEIIDRELNRYELVPKGFSKATACSFILEHFGISLERCYVFGDSSNDLAMFQFAPHGIAMGSHSSILEPYTEFVTKTVEEDGIAYALSCLGLI